MTHYEARPILGSASDLGEGTLWDERSGFFIWVDIFKNTIKRYNPKTGEISKVVLGKSVTYVGKRDGGGFVLALGDSIAFTDKSFKIEREIKLDFDARVLRTNDGNIDPSGSLWVGTMASAIGGSDVVEGGVTGELYKFDRELNKSVHRKNIQIANGMDWSLDGTMMFYIDSAPRKIYRYQFDPKKGEIVRELSAIDVSDVTGVPDGMCTDSLGNLWVAFWGCGQVRNYTPEGELLNIVQAPTALTTCPSFGGEELKTLFITSAQDQRDPEFAFDSVNDPYGGMCFEVRLPIAGKLDNFYNG